MPRFPLRVAVPARACAAVLLALALTAGVIGPVTSVAADNTHGDAAEAGAAGVLADGGHADAYRRTSQERSALRRAASGAATIVSVSEPVLWPNPADEAGPRASVMTYTIDQPGDYTLAVTQGDWVFAERDLGTVDASSEERTWTWRGRGLARIPVERGDYQFEIVRNTGPTTIEIVATAGVEVHNGTGTREVRDHNGEPGAGRADLRWFTLANSPDAVGIAWDFRERIRRSFASAQVTLDAGRARVYRIVVTRRRGVAHATVHLTDPASGDQKQVRCRSARATIGARRVTVTIGQSCLRIGGARLRASYDVATHRGRYRDAGPDTGRAWTGWTAYENRPIASPTA